MENSVSGDRPLKTLHLHQNSQGILKYRQLFLIPRVPLPWVPHLQRLLSCAARLLLQFASIESLNVAIALLVAGVQQLVLGLQQPLARGDIANPNGEAAVRWELGNRGSRP